MCNDLCRASNNIFFFLTHVILIMAQPKGYIYDESKVPIYDLPEILKEETSLEKWETLRREQIVRNFEEYVYGDAPVFTGKIMHKIVEQGSHALGKRKQINLVISEGSKQVELQILAYIPGNIEGPVPLFLGLNFNGNHAVTSDPAVLLPTGWVRKGAFAENNEAREKGRGYRKSYWNIDYILSQGYGLVTVHYGDIDPDYDDGFRNGVHSLYDNNEKKHTWGSIAAWAWGISRIVDYLEKDEDFDHERIILMGHSRLGKAALWAGALDQRFACVISNNSGCGGAALSRRKFGETIQRINTSFPHWFCGNLNKYNNNENECPVDQHMLLSLIAPRGLYIASAQDDLWADPHGEFLSLYHSSIIYEKYGSPRIQPNLPEPNKPIIGKIGYHIREGKHAVTPFDWEQFVNFANANLKFSN